MEYAATVQPILSRKAGRRFWVRLPWHRSGWLLTPGGKRKSFATENKAQEAAFAAEDAAREARIAEAQKWGRSVAQDAIDMGERDDFSGYLENLSDAMKEHMKGFDGLDYQRAYEAFKARLAEAGIDPALVH